MGIDSRRRMVRAPLTLLSTSSLTASRVMALAGIIAPAMLTLLSPEAHAQALFTYIGKSMTKDVGSDPGCPAGPYTMSGSIYALAPGGGFASGNFTAGGYSTGDIAPNFTTSAGAVTDSYFDHQSTQELASAFAP